MNAITTLQPGMPISSGSCLDDEPVSIGARTLTCKALQDRIREAHAAIGHEGRFALTFTVREDGREDAYLTHWFRPTPEAFEDCRSVGLGSIMEVLAAMERYVSNYRRKPTTEEVGRTLGVSQAAE